ncbi:MAG TPA: pyridoxal-phosphate dependent enzyme [Thermoanaerobaculia bacterium]|nr:pyridoxal-phosphate dependent enzyme [Thermoanaerobaculia bacterium]
MDVRRAAERLAPYAHPTPLVSALLLSRELGCDLWVKNETVSPVASFKWRGALNDILTAPSDVVTSSTGNHGQGVAWAAGVAGVRAHVFLPLGANPLKRSKIELLGARVHDTGHDLDDAKAQAMEFARERGLRFVDDGDSPGVIEGAGTIGLEIARELRPDVVFVPMGSGSLAAGIAMAMPGTRVVAVQSSGSPAMVESFHARRAIERPIATIADGLVCRVPAQLALDALLAHVADAMLVSDEELLDATRLMILGAHVLVEPSGAAGLAAAMRSDVRGKRVVVIATGANITAEVFAKLARA